MKNQKNCSFFIYIVAIFALLLSACSLDSSQPCLEPGEKFPDPSIEEEYIAFTIQNGTCMSICQVFVSPDHCEYMGGVNWVDDHPLRSEESITQYIPAGRYAVWVELCTEEFRADEHLNSRSDYTHTIFDDPNKGGEPPCGTSLTIINNSTVPICKMWISNSGSTYNSWNWIGAEKIQPGETLELTLRPDIYDLRAEACDDTRLRFEGDVLISGHLDWIVP